MTRTLFTIGSRKVDRDVVLPFILLPILFLIATLSFIITIIVMVVIGMGVLYVYSRPQQKNRSLFFMCWTISSALWLFLTHRIVYNSVPEHLIQIILSLYTLYFFVKAKMVADFELALGSSKGKEYCPMITSDSKHCPICEIEVNGRFFHSIWWNCCIFRPNYLYFLGGNIFALLTLLYCSNMYLTTVCENQLYFNFIVAPKYCVHMYDEFFHAYVFVISFYSLGYVCIITLVLIKQLLVYVPKYAEPQWKGIRSVLNV